MMQAGPAGESGTAILAQLATWTSGRAHLVARGILDLTYISGLAVHREYFTGAGALTTLSTVALKAAGETKAEPACQAQRT